MLDQKILFIGGGHMAEGIIRGQIKHNVFSPANIYVNDVLSKRLDYLKQKYQVNAVQDVSQVISDMDIIFIAVRPQNAPEVLAEVKKANVIKPLILSIVAGLTLTELKTSLPAKDRVARIMPNVLIDAQEGYSGVCTGDQVTAEDQQVIKQILSALGQTMFIDERMFNAFTAFSCSGPAYILQFAQALIDAGVQSGFSRSDATKMVLSNLIGSAKRMQITGEKAYEIIDQMTSPAGVTIEALQSLQESGFNGIVMKAIAAAVKKSNRL